MLLSVKPLKRHYDANNANLIIISLVSINNNRNSEELHVDATSSHTQNFRTFLQQWKEDRERMREKERDKEKRENEKADKRENKENERQ